MKRLNENIIHRVWLPQNYLCEVHDQKLQVPPHSYTLTLFQDSSEKNHLITLPNGVRLTFGNVIALAGDYYGIPDAPISDPSLNPDQVDAGALQRFKDAYSTLAVTPYEGKHKVWTTGEKQFYKSNF